MSAPLEDASVSFCVLASGSAGNCSVLEYRRGEMRRACLIDLGLAPRRTIRLLAALGLGMHQIDDVLVTHLDHDHYHHSWARFLPRHVRVRLHARHVDRAGWTPLPDEHLLSFDSPFELQCGIGVQPLTLAHDEAGVTVFRFDIPGSLGGGRLGFATDLGRVTRGLIDLFTGDGRGVDVLAIESNYCPDLQRSSARPEFLKRRIMGGRGHLSNHEALEAIGRIRPLEHVVLLHLSRECNDPSLVARLHEGADYALTITSQDEPTRWVRVGSGAGAGVRPRPVVRPGVTPSLFESLPS